MFFYFYSQLLIQINNMKNSFLQLSVIFGIIILGAVLFTSCEKSFLKDKCEFKEKYIYEPLVFDEACDCIVAGKVKYLKDCKTAALVDYGNGACDNIATKTICVNGKCEARAGAYTVDFEIDCKESVEEGPISKEEAEAIGI